MYSAMGNCVLFGTWQTWIPPLWKVAAGAAGTVVVLYLVALAIRSTVPKVAAIAQATAKEAMAQPLFYLLAAVGVFAILLFPFLSYNTFGEDLKMVKAEGLTLIKILGIILAVWTASVSISDEIEGRTALTLLSKPVGRAQLILGKFLGVLMPVAILFIILSVVFLATISYKVDYEARETCNPDPTMEMCEANMVQIVPGLALAFMESVILSAIGVAVSTRLPMLPNLMICASVYVLGHLVPNLVQSAMGKFDLVKFMGRFLAAIFPVLDYFSVEAAISADQVVPLSYLGWTAVYCALYTTVAMLLALLLFEDRDLA
jgi:ABC-type transport system involved in multi-copper enzyme maturation permease subunit